MARFLSIDWEQQQLHIVQAATSRAGVRVEQALSWTFPEPLTPASAEGLGKKLRDALKEANVTTAPVLACVGRERLILKELRYPPVAPQDEPAIVRFQAAKEMTEAVDEVVIDYTPMGSLNGGGERHALAVIVRKDVVTSLQGLSRGLGMKLLAITPRPLAVIGALDRSRLGKVSLGGIEALLTIGSRYADLSILRGQTLLFARSLAVGPTLAGEVKRSLTVFSATSEVPVQTLFVASDGDESTLCLRLQELLGVPVQLLDSFLPEDAVQVDKARRGRFTAAIGLVQRWSEAPELALNFVSPKEPKPLANPRKRQKVMAGILCVAVLFFLVMFANFVLANKRSQIKGLEAQRVEQEALSKTLTQDRLDIEALKDWDNTTISWLDELYDMAARFPGHKGFRVNILTANTLGKKGKDRYVASVTLSGVVPASDVTLVHQFMEEINRTGTLQATSERIKAAGPNMQEFQVKVMLVHQTPDKYTTPLKSFPFLKGAPVRVEEKEADDAEGEIP